MGVGAHSRCIVCGMGRDGSRGLQVCGREKRTGCTAISAVVPRCSRTGQAATMVRRPTTSEGRPRLRFEFAVLCKNLCQHGRLGM